MSNIKISNLPLIPSVSPDDVLPIVDSGFTTTYKVKVSSLQGTSGTSGVSGTSGTSGSSGLGFTWQGGWQSITTYFINDVVYYSGASYVALGTIAAGGNPPDVNASWENMSAQGQAGTNGTSGTSGVSGSSGSSGTDGTSGSSGTSGTSGQSNSVYSGGTLVVNGATILNFSGATITDAGGGQADITITPGTQSPIKQVGTSILPTSSTNTNDDMVIIGNTTISNNFITNSVAIGNNKNVSGPRVVSIGNNQFQLVDDCTYIGHGAGGSGNGGVVAIGGAVGRGNYGISIGTNSVLGNLAGCDRTLGIGAETSINGNYSSNIGAQNTLNCERGSILGTTNTLRSPYGSIIGNNNNISSTEYYNNIIGGNSNIISGTTSGATILGCYNRTAFVNDAVHLEKLVIMTPLTEYANNAAAKAGGLVDGQLYRDNGGKVHIVFT
jgi:hypothetical protein